MVTFDLKHYECLGYQEISLPSGVQKGWIIKPRIARLDQNGVRVVPEAKLVDHGNVYFCKVDGRVENRQHQTTVLPPR